MQIEGIEVKGQIKLLVIRKRLLAARISHRKDRCEAEVQDAQSPSKSMGHVLSSFITREARSDLDSATEAGYSTIPNAECLYFPRCHVIHSISSSRSNEMLLSRYQKMESSITQSRAIGSSAGLDDAENRCSNSRENFIGRFPTISSIVSPPDKSVHCVNQIAWRLTPTYSRLVRLLLDICIV
jgi:hypothetical protein